MKIAIKDLIAENEVRFSSYRKGVLSYTISYRGQEYLFPVPLEDTGDATFALRDRAIYFMRYIRQAIEAGEFVKVSPETEAPFVHQ